MDQLAQAFEDTFNLSLLQSEVPTSLKTTTIISVPQKALTSTIMKSFARLVMVTWRALIHCYTPTATATSPWQMLSPWPYTHPRYIWITRTPYFRFLFIDQNIFQHHNSNQTHFQNSGPGFSKPSATGPSTSRTIDCNQ